MVLLWQTDVDWQTGKDGTGLSGKRSAEMDNTSINSFQ